MILTTGPGDDSVSYDPFRSDFDIWQDAGGTDALLLPDYEAMPFRAFAYDGRALTLHISGTVLTVPDAAPGTPSLEFVEYQSIAYDAGDAVETLARLRVITDPGAGLGADVLAIGSAEDDVIVAPVLGARVDGFSEIFGNGGNDTIVLSPTQDYRAFGGRGRDVIEGRGASEDFIAGGGGRDKLLGRLGEDEIYGGRGDDVIRGGSGDDFIYGDGPEFPPARGFDDRLFGGRGADHLIGGAGVDVMTGGRGADSFHFTLWETEEQPDRIRDFTAGRDRLEIDTDTSPGWLRVKAQGEDTLVRLLVDHYGETLRYDLVLLEGVTLTRSEIDVDWL